jgi:carboxyl-terminal processing protease
MRAFSRLGSKPARFAVRLVVLILVFLITTGFTSSTLDQIGQLIEIYYYGDIPPGVWEAQTPHGMVDALGDPYSEYFTAEEFNEFYNGINMEFEGIGAYVESVPEGILLTSIFDGSGASDAGLLQGDIIVKADGLILSGLSLEEGISHIKGPDGTWVDLVILRDGQEFEVSVQRKKIHIPAVTGTIEDGTGYIRIYSFSENISSEFHDLLKQMEEENAKGYIIDVRGNPGGFLDSVVELLGYFIGSKTSLISRDKHGNTFYYNALAEEAPIDKPIVVLVDEYSASASEIFAAAIKDYESAVIMGSTTYGKGTVQNLFLLPEGDAVKLTVQHFYSPLDNEINEKGVEPHIDTGDADPLPAAKLLMAGQPEAFRLSGFLKLAAGGKAFYIDLNSARTDENWEALNAILEALEANGGSLSHGGGLGWRGFKASDWADKPRVLFPDYKILADLKDVPAEKEFTITFNRSIDPSTITASTVELIDGESGERAELSISQLTGSRVKVVPKKPLKPGGTYYLAINPGITDIKGHVMGKGTVVEVTIRR